MTLFKEDTPQEPMSLHIPSTPAGTTSILPKLEARNGAPQAMPAGANPQTISLQMSASSWASLLFLSTLWGGSFFFMKIILTELPPFTLVCARLSLAALVIGLYAALTRVKIRLEPKLWPLFAGIGLMNNVVPFSLLTFGQTLMPHGLSASLAAILNATTPMFGIILAHFFTKDEKLSAHRALGMVVGFFGVSVIMLPALLRYLSGAGQGTHLADFWFLLGMGACILASLIYSCGALLSRKAQALKLSPVQATIGQVTFAAVFSLPLCLAHDAPWQLPLPSFAALACLGALAVVSTAYAYLLYFKILVRTGATNIMLVTFLVPVTTIILTAVFLGERLESVHFIGMGLIGFGLALIDGRMVAGFKRLRP